jgi:glycosyltransferase involved in cell wall biosynthesis
LGGISDDNPTFVASRKRLSLFLKESFENNPVALFDSLLQKGERQLTHYVFRKAVKFILPGRVDVVSGWKEALDSSITSSISFFKRAKTLMFSFSSGDPEIFKKILPILLEIQTKYLPLLEEDKTKMEEARRWIDEYRYISDTFDPGNLHAFLKLFYSLRSKAKIYKGKIPTNAKEKFEVLRQLHLFDIYKNNFYYHHWEKLATLEVSSLPQELLFLLVIINRPKRFAFKSLYNPRGVCPSKLFNFNPDFNNLIKFYEKKFNKNIYYVVIFLTPPHILSIFCVIAFAKEILTNCTKRPCGL